jgi:hypothetical protein
MSPSGFEPACSRFYCLGNERHTDDVIMRWPSQPLTIGIEKHKIEREYFSQLD